MGFFVVEISLNNLLNIIFCEEEIINLAIIFDY